VVEFRGVYIRKVETAAAHHLPRALTAPVADLIDARHRQAGRFGELLARDAMLEPLADKTA
jgi:hypothetical protein